VKKILSILVISLLACSCGNKSEQNKLDKILAEDNYIVVDVRTKEEYEESHVVDSINIPYDEISKSTNLDKDKIILVYCKSGNRSSIADKTLTNLGYEVYDLGALSKIDMPKE